MPRFAQQIGERHRKAAGVRGPDQFFRVCRALHVFNPGAQRERTLVGAAAHADAASATRQVALPAGVCGACHPDAHGGAETKPTNLAIALCVKLRPTDAARDRTGRSAFRWLRWWTSST